MKRLFCLIAILAICSCAETEPADGAKPEQETKNTSTNFTFAGIEYSLGENDGAEYFEKKYDTFTFNNGGSLEQKYPFQPEKNIYERSGFSSFDTRAFAFIEEGMKVEIPVAISDGGRLVLDDGTRWDYHEGDRELRPIATEYVTEYVIPPDHTFTLITTYTLRVLSADYKLHLKGVEFGETVTVEGRWWGVFYVGCDVSATLEQM